MFEKVLVNRSNCVSCTWNLWSLIRFFGVFMLPDAVKGCDTHHRALYSESLKV